jgi:HK97 gp10 family phage protein
MGILHFMKVNITGFEKVQKQFSDMEKDLEGAVKAALFDGAKIAADEVKRGLESLPVQEDKNGNPPFVPKNGTPLHGITSTQKEDLISSMGVAPFKTDSKGTNTSIGFNGYGRSTWKGGQPLPNQVLMREVESGTSWMQKHPVIRPAMARTKEKIKAEMAKTFKEKEKVDNG